MNRKPHNKITNPPTKENVKLWVIEKYGNDFEPTFLNNIVNEYNKSTIYHNQYAKKLTIKYISENILKWERIYRKQEILYWVKRGWDEKISETKRIIRNKQWYLDNYGETEGLLKFNRKNENISNNCGHSLEKFIVKYGVDKGNEKWGDFKVNSRRDLNFYIRKYGEEKGIISFNNKIKKLAHTLDNYIERHGEIEGTIKFNNHKKSCSRGLGFFISKYGEIDGKIKYKEFKKCYGKASKESMLVFNPIIDYVKEFIDISEIYYGSNNSREFFISNNGKIFLYDFTIKSLNIIIEFFDIKIFKNQIRSINLIKYK